MQYIQITFYPPAISRPYQPTSFTIAFLLSIEGNKTNVQTKQNKIKKNRVRQYE